MTLSTWPSYRPNHSWQEQPRSDLSNSAEPPPRILLTRPLGLLEAKFDIPTQDEGKSDIFLRLTLTTSAVDKLVSRLVLGWIALRAQHPALAVTAHDAAQAPNGWIRGVKPREFRYEVARDELDALEDGLASLSLFEADIVEDEMDRIQQAMILNGERVMLDQAECLSRLVIIRANDCDRVGLFLVISHIVRTPSSITRGTFFRSLTCFNTLALDIGRALGAQLGQGPVRNRRGPFASTAPTCAVSAAANPSTAHSSASHSLMARP